VANAAPLAIRRRIAASSPPRPPRSSTTPTSPQRSAHLRAFLAALVDALGPAHARVTAELLEG
jgi:hypothetical protein